MRTLIPNDGHTPLVTLGERETPVPASNEALVAVEAFSINRGETFLLERPRPDARPGKDIAGRIIEPAADGSGPAHGVRVVGHPPRGGWAEHVEVATTSLAVLPETVTAEDAAALPLAGLTALRLLRAAPPVSGERVLLTGASGGVGHFLVELSASAGARVTAVSATEERGRRLLDLGAESVVQKVQHATGPFDTVFESVGGTLFVDALHLLRPHGRLMWFGQASRQPIELDFFSLFEQTGASIQHFHYEDSEESIAHDLETLVRLLSEGRLHPEVGLDADWACTADVIERLRAREIRGKAILRVKP